MSGGKQTWSACSLSTVGECAHTLVAPCTWLSLLTVFTHLSNCWHTIYCTACTICDQVDGQNLWSTYASHNKTLGHQYKIMIEHIIIGLTCSANTIPAAAVKLEASEVSSITLKNWNTHTTRRAVKWHKRILHTCTEEKVHHSNHCRQICATLNLSCN